MKINRMKSENIIFEKFDVSSLQLARKKWQIFDIVIEVRNKKKRNKDT